MSVGDFANVYASINNLQNQFDGITGNTLSNYNQLSRIVFQQGNIYNSIYYGTGNIVSNNIVVNNNANIIRNDDMNNGNLIINNSNLILNNNSKIALGTNYGSSGQVIVSNGISSPPVWDSSLILLTQRTLSTSGTPSGSSATYLNIPSWVNQIVVTINQASTNGTAVPNLLLGTSAGLVTSGYSGSVGAYSGEGGDYLSTNILLWNTTWSAANIFYSVITFYHMGSNIWVFRINTSLSNSALATVGNGTVTLPGTLDRVQLTINGTQLFDNGTINIRYQ